MTVYLAYAAEYMEVASLVGVYSNMDSAIRHAQERANELDNYQHRIFDGDEDWEFVPAKWFVNSVEVME